MNKGHIEKNFAIWKNILIQFFRANPAVEKIAIFTAALVVGISLGSTINLFQSAGAESYISATSETAVTEPKVYTELPEVEKATTPVIQQTNAYTQPKTGAGILYIPEINLHQQVATASTSGSTINVPSYGVAVYNGNVLVGHNTGVFSGLTSVKAGSTINYNGRDYTVYKTEVAYLINQQQVKTTLGARDTKRLSNENPLVLMTCYGAFNAAYNTAEARFIVYAQ